jgi:hypothetical protein
VSVGESPPRETTTGTVFGARPNRSAIAVVAPGSHRPN